MAWRLVGLLPRVSNGVGEKNRWDGCAIHARGQRGLGPGAKGNSLACHTAARAEVQINLTLSMAGGRGTLARGNTGQRIPLNSFDSDDPSEVQAPRPPRRPRRSVQPVAAPPRPLPSALPSALPPAAAARTTGIARRNPHCNPHRHRINFVAAMDCTKYCDACSSSLKHETVYYFQDAAYCRSCCPWTSFRPCVPSAVGATPETVCRHLPSDHAMDDGRAPSSIASSESLASSMESCKLSPTSVHRDVHQAFAPEPWHDPPARPAAAPAFACCVGR